MTLLNSFIGTKIGQKIASILITGSKDLQASALVVTTPDGPKIVGYASGDVRFPVDAVATLVDHQQTDLVNGINAVATAIYARIDAIDTAVTAGHVSVPGTAAITHIVSSPGSAVADVLDLAEALDAWIALLGAARLPPGGTTGQVLTKTSGTDYARAWSDLPDPPTPPPGFLTSHGVPDDGDGVDGDMNLDVDASPPEFYGPKTAGTWGATIGKLTAP